MNNDDNKLLIILPGLLMGTYWGLIKVPLPALSELASYFHTNYHKIQQIFSMAFVITGISAIFWGPIIDKFNPKKFILVMAISIIIVSIILSFTTTLYAFSFLFGLCCIMTAALMILARTLPILCFSDEAVIKKSLSNVMLCGYLCAWLAPLISGYLIRYTSWRSIFFIIPIVLLFIIFASRKIPQHIATMHQKKRFIENIRSMKRHLKLSSFSQNVTILAFSAGFAQSSLICVPFWVTSHYHPPSDIIAYLILLMLIPGFFAPVINKFFIHKFPQTLRAMESRRLRPVVRSRRRFLADRFAGTAKAPDFSLIP
ncbi:MAG: multidrug effflux MFS transporter [Gammaproteobacteria bacterium]|nr:multidrug effflux MFS transporter [Gammaproteobacteria bacterium]